MVAQSLGSRLLKKPSATCKCTMQNAEETALILHSEFGILH
jgi:hypothetical protein